MIITCIFHINKSLEVFFWNLFIRIHNFSEKKLHSLPQEILKCKFQTISKIYDCIKSCAFFCFAIKVYLYLNSFQCEYWIRIQTFGNCFFQFAKLNIKELIVFEYKLLFNFVLTINFWKVFIELFRLV